MQEIKARGGRGLETARPGACLGSSVCADLADLSRRLRNFEPVTPEEIAAFKARAEAATGEPA